MLARNSSIGKDPKLLLELNRPRLKKIFTRLHPSKDGRISFVDITKFCRSARLYPVTHTQDVVSTRDLKAMLEKIRPNYPTSSITISFLQFEQLIARIAGMIKTPQTGGKIQAVLELIQTHSGELYGVSFAFSGSRHSPAESFHSDNSQPKSQGRDQKYSESPRIQHISTTANSKGYSVVNLQNSARISLPVSSPAGSHTTDSSNLKPRGATTRLNLGRVMYGALNSTRHRSCSKDMNSSQPLESKKLRGERRPNTILLCKPILASQDSTPTSLSLGNFSNISQTLESFRLKHEMLAVRTPSREKPVKTQLRHYQDFLWRVRSSSFSSDFVKRIIFLAWRETVEKLKRKSPVES